MTAKEQVSMLVQNARTAQKLFETYPQEQVDMIVRAVGKAVYDNAEPLARLAVEETKMGVYEDKIQKNAGKPKAVWQHLKGVKSRGIIRYIEEKGLVEVAKPIGVVGAVTPVTNPTMTLMHNVMIALKGGNAIIICPHPAGKVCGVRTVEVINAAIHGLGAPEDLVQIIEEPTMELSALVMQETDVCISTGGPGVVRVAYRSGRPAFGVGAGNIQCLIDRDADIPDAVAKIVRGRTYDNGILCTCEQFVFCPEEKFPEIINAFRKNGGHYISDPGEIDRLRSAAFPGGTINKGLVGTSPIKIAEAAGIKVPDDTKLLVVKVERCGKDELLAREKLFPVLSVFCYDTWENAVEGAKANLEVEGKGHSAVIHSFTKSNIEYAAENICVSRFVVNQIGSNSLGGTLSNGLAPTGTLGCGSWGNNSISENLDYHHLINISRIAYFLPDARIFSDDEIWN